MVDTGNSYLGIPEVYYSDVIMRLFGCMRENTKKDLVYVIEGDEYQRESSYYMVNPKSMVEQLTQTTSWLAPMSVSISP